MGGERESEDSDEDDDFPSPVSLLFGAVAPFSKEVASSVRSRLRWFGGEVGGTACLRARSFVKMAGRSL